MKDFFYKTLNTLKKVTKYICYTVLLLLIVLAVYTFIVTDVLKKDYVNVFGYTYFQTASGSMSGTIEINDIIIVKITKDVEENDIISYINEDNDIITHRLIEKSGNRLIAKGDANGSEDDPITKDAVLGKVINIISPRVIIEFIAVCLILIIGVALLNFDKIFKKVIDKEEKDNYDFDKQVLPQDVFSSPKDRKDYEHTGLTITIPLNEIHNMNKPPENEELDNTEVLDLDSNSIVKSKTSQKAKENELLDMINSLLKIKKSSIDTSHINKKWLAKYQFVYRLCHIVKLGDTRSLYESVEHPSFKEIYDYDIDKIGLYENLRNKLYHMPLYVFLKVLFIAIMYNDEDFFDGVFKIMKYKIMVDTNNEFREIDRNDSYAISQIKDLIKLMEKVSKKYDDKNIFELEKIERLAKIKNYINE